MTGRTRAQIAMRLALIVLAPVFVPSAGAQTIPEGQSCGGLVCDLGLIGHKTAPAPAALPPVAAPKPTAEIAPVEKPRTPRPRKRLVSKPIARPPAVAARPATAPVAPAPIVAAPTPVVVAPAPVVAAPAPVVAARPARAAPPAVAAQAPPPAPLYQRPLIFQSIDPTLQ